MTEFDFNAAKVTTVSKSELAKKQTMALNNLDALAREMERKWGQCRLPSLVADDLADRFYNQHRKTSEALRSGDVKEATAQIERMATAWRYLDQEADRMGAEPLHPCVWETILKDGTVVAIVRDEDESGAVDALDRNVRVYQLSEIVRLIEAMPDIAKIKETFPGAKVQETRIRNTDDNWWEAGGDPIPF